ncbi:MAG: hypothetical protein ACHQQS_02245 [Thermoanaerobaculales bacterium]
MNARRSWLAMGIAGAAVAVLILGPVRINISLAVTTIGYAWHDAWGTTPEARQIAFYGDRSGLGYGYVRDVLEHYPDPESLPEIRNPGHDDFLRLFLPGRLRRRDDRMLIGIGIPEAQLRESTVATAVRVAADQHESGWQFATGTDVDTFVGLDVTVSGKKGLAGTAELLAGVQDPSVLASGRIENPGGDQSVVRFRPVPFHPFSIQRGATPFRIRMTGVVPERIEVMGIPTDIRGYEILSRERNCFVAVRQDAKELLSGPGAKPWLTYFRRLRCGSL